MGARERPLLASNGNGGNAFVTAANWTALFQIFRSFQPSDLVGVHQWLPLWLAALFVVIGVACLLLGNGRSFRFIAGPMAGLAGTLWLPMVLVRVGLPAETVSFSAAAGGALFVLGVLTPPFALFFFVGLPAGLVAGHFAGPDVFLLAFTPAFVVAGTLAAMFHEAVAAVATSVLGAWLTVLGALRLGSFLWPWLSEVAQRQAWAAFLIGGFLATAGTLYQIVIKRTGFETRRRTIEEMKAQRRVTEKRALEKKWMGDQSWRGKKP